jgi:hypothetical protein
LFTDFDEYALYSLRDLDIGGPDFVYPPPALDGLARGYGAPVDLDPAAPSALQRYPLIVTRRNPASSPPPTAYRLAWSGTYYEVWERQAGAPVALQHKVLPHRLTARCRELTRLASGLGHLVAALPPELLSVDLGRAAYPAHWAHERSRLVIGRGGHLSASFTVPRAGVWKLWLQGQFMPPISLAIDKKSVGKIAGQLGGNSLVPDTSAALSLSLDAGTHRLTLARGGFTLAPGNGGAAVLDRIFLTPAGTPARTIRTVTSAAAARSLCRSPLQWVELLPT